MAPYCDKYIKFNLNFKICFWINLYLIKYIARENETVFKVFLDGDKKFNLDYYEFKFCFFDFDKDDIFIGNRVSKEYPYSG